MSDKQKWAFLGFNGWIGSQYVSYVEEHASDEVDIVKCTFDCNFITEIYDNLVELKPDRVVCMIGRKYASDKYFEKCIKKEGKCITTIEDELPYHSLMEMKRECLERNMHKMMKDNYYSIKKVSLVCTELNIHLTILNDGDIYDSKDCPSRIFDVDDIPNNDVTNYTFVKSFIDLKFRDIPKVMLIRIKHPINFDFNDKNNYLRKIIDLKTSSSVQDSFTVLPEVFSTLTMIIVNGWYGTFNLVNPGSISIDEILNMYKQLVDKEYPIHECTHSADIHSVLSSRRSELLYVTRVSKISESIKKIFCDWHKCINE